MSSHEAAGEVRAESLAQAIVRFTQRMHYSGNLPPAGGQKSDLEGALQKRGCLLEVEGELLSPKS